MGAPGLCGCQAITTVLELLGDRLTDELRARRASFPTSKWCRIWAKSDILQRCLTAARDLAFQIARRSLIFLMILSVFGGSSAAMAAATT